MCLFGRGIGDEGGVVFHKMISTWAKRVCLRYRAGRGSASNSPAVRYLAMGNPSISLFCCFLPSISEGTQLASASLTSVPPCSSLCDPGGGRVCRCCLLCVRVQNSRLDLMSARTPRGTPIAMPNFAPLLRPFRAFDRSGVAVAVAAAVVFIVVAAGLDVPNVEDDVEDEADVVVGVDLDVDEDNVEADDVISVDVDADVDVETDVDVSGDVVVVIIDVDHVIAGRSILRVNLQVSVHFFKIFSYPANSISPTLSCIK